MTSCGAMTAGSSDSGPGSDMRWNFPLFETRVGRRLVALFLLSAIAPICLLSVFAYRHVAGQLEMQSRDRLATLAKTTGMGIGQRLLILARALDHHARQIGGRSGDVVALTDSLEVPPGLRALTTERVPEAGSLADESRNRLEIGRPILDVHAETGEIRLGVMIPGTGHVLWGTADPEFLWGVRDGEAPLPVGTDLCVFADASVPPLVCTAPAPAILRRALAGDGAGAATPVLWDVEDGWQQGSAWSLFLAYEFGAAPWHTIVSEEAALIRAPLQSFGSTFTGIVFLTTFVVLGLSAWLIRRNMVPLRELQEATILLANQNLRHRVTVPSPSRNEFHDLAHSFNRMAGQIERHVGSLQATNAIDRAILSTLNRTEAAAVILQHGLDLLPCEVMGFGLARTEDPADPWDFTLQHPGTHQSCVGVLEWNGRQREYLAAEPGGSPLPPETVEQLQDAQLIPATITHVWSVPVMGDRDLVGMLLLGSSTPTDLDHTTQMLVRHLADQAAVAISNIRLVEALGELHRGALQALARTIDAKSPWTAGHSERVTAIAVELGKWIGLPEPEIERLHRGGLLHDIGKIGIPGEILDKAGPLTKEERAIIETHPVVGARILTPVTPYADVLGIVRSHHERWDGKGYPDRLAGKAIPRLARILAVADVYDAVSSARPYRDSMAHDEVLAIIRQGIGTSFDPAVASAFLAMMAGRPSGHDPLSQCTPEDLNAQPVTVFGTTTQGSVA